MGGDYYDDILDDNDSKMGGYSVASPWDRDDPEQFTVKIKSEPKKGLGLEHGFKMLADNQFEHKTELKKSCPTGQFEHSISASHNGFNWKGQITPDDWNKDGIDAQIKLGGSCAP